MMVTTASYNPVWTLKSCILNANFPQFGRGKKWVLVLIKARPKQKTEQCRNAMSTEVFDDHPRISMDIPIAVSDAHWVVEKQAKIIILTLVERRSRHSTKRASLEHKQTA